MMEAEVRYSLALFFQECIIETLSEEEINNNADLITKVDTLVERGADMEAAPAFFNDIEDFLQERLEKFILDSGLNEDSSIYKLFFNSMGQLNVFENINDFEKCLYELCAELGIEREEDSRRDENILFEERSQKRRALKERDPKKSKKFQEEIFAPIREALKKAFKGKNVNFSTFESVGEEKASIYVDMRGLSEEVQNGFNYYKLAETLKEDDLYLFSYSLNKETNQLELIFKKEDILKDYIESTDLISEGIFENLESERNSKLLDCYQSFALLASTLLIEPELYLNDKNNLKKEIESINNVFYNKLDITPSFYSVLSSSIIRDSTGIRDLQQIQRRVNTKRENAVAAGAVGSVFVGLALSLTPVGWGILLGGVVISFGSEAISQIAASDGSNLARLLIATKTFMNSLDQSLAKKRVEILNENQINDETVLNSIFNKSSEADLTNLGIENYIKKYYVKMKAFQNFETLSRELNSSFTAAQLITGKSDIFKTENSTTNTVFTSNELAGAEISKYLTFLLSFPEEKGTINDRENFEDVFELKEDGVLIKKDVNLNDLFYPTFNGKRSVVQSNEKIKPLIEYQLNKNIKNSIQKGYFEDKSNKAELKKEQDKRLGFLKSLFDKLIEDISLANIKSLYEYDPTIVEKLDEKSVFSLIEDSAYPDIDTPVDYFNNTESGNPLKFSPYFYYSDIKTNNYESNYGIAQAKKIIERSLKFEEDINSGVITDENFNSKSIPIYSDELLLDSDALPKERQSLIAGTGISLKRNDDDLRTISANNGLQMTSTQIANIPSDKLENYFDGLKESFEERLESDTLFQSFGSKLNYFENINTTSNFEIESGSGVKIEEDFNEEVVFNLSKDSSRGIYEVNSIKKAFPTFRLYLIEEDSIYSDRLLAYDDFFYYNSVVSFTTHESKELNASTANIQLQNISGILDGTKKGTTRDIDVDKYRNGKGDSDDNFFVEDIVLRPGVNVQLRAGYGVSTKDLEVILSGRITEVNYSSDNMLVNITVQSYQVELENIKKVNEVTGGINNVYGSTHQLLGALALSPELKHFGRIKEGKFFQILENKTPSLDMNEYGADNGWSWNWTKGWLDWYEENEMYVIIGLSLLDFVGPMIRGLGVALRNAPILGGLVRGSRAVGQALVRWSPLRVIDLTRRYTSTSGRKLFQSSDELLEAIEEVAARNPGDFLPLYPSPSSYLSPFRNRFAGQLPSSVRTYGELLRYLKAVGTEEFGMIFGLTGLGLSETARAAFRAADTAGISIGGSIFGRQVIREAGIRSFGANTLNFFVYPLRLTAISASINITIGTIIGIAEGITNSIVAGWKAIKKYYEEEKLPSTRKTLLSPQDDNIFAPHPNDYMKNGESPAVTEEGNETRDFGSWSNFRNQVLNSINLKKTLIKSGGGILFSLGSIDKESLNMYLSEIKGIEDRRLDIQEGENLYRVNGQTLWNVMKDMERRHPGYIATSRPYGQGLEYRIFFGLPNQRYFKKDISLFKTIRLNKLYSYLNSKDSTKGIELYPEAFLRLKERNKEIKDSQIEIICKDLALKEWIETTKERYVPFRQFYSVDSKKNIVGSNIVISGHNVINAITVNYFKNSSGSKKYNQSEMSLESYKTTANKNIPPSHLKETVLSGENIIGAAQAARYALSGLIEGAKQMYSGSVTILGDARIRPYDIIVLKDRVNAMYGVLEVKSVTHLFSHETGFITDLEIEAVVTGKDNMNYSLIQQTVFHEARVELFEQYSSRYELSEEDFETKIRETIKASIETRLDKDKYLQQNAGLTVGSVIDLTEDPLKDEKTRLTDYLSSQFIKRYRESKESGEPFFLNDVIAPDALIPQEIENDIKRIGKNIALTGAGSVGIGVAGHLWNSVRNGFTEVGRGSALVLGGITIAIGTAAYFFPDEIRRIMSSSLSNGTLGRNLFKDVILNKYDNDTTIKVYPLVKDGKPLLAGGFETLKSNSLWKNIAGNIFCQTSDGMDGYLRRIAEIKSRSPEILTEGSSGFDFIERKEVETNIEIGDQEIPTRVVVYGGIK